MIWGRISARPYEKLNKKTYKILQKEVREIRHRRETRTPFISWDPQKRVKIRDVG
jgi:hypothetical protein